MYGSRVFCQASFKPQFPWRRDNAGLDEGLTFSIGIRPCQWRPLQERAAARVDREAYLWNCRYGGACIVRVAPDGAIDRVIEMPAANIANCTFGGGDYRTLYATSASLGAAPGDRLAGGLFAIQTEVAGLPENRFRIAGIRD